MGFNGAGLFGAGLHSGSSFSSEAKAFEVGPIILLELELPSGDQYLAGTSVRFSSRAYDGRILSMTPHRRAIQQNLGLFEVSAIDVEIADTDKKFIELTNTTDMKGAVARFKIGTKKLPFDSFQTFHEGLIDTYGVSEFVFRLTVSDRLWTLPEAPETGFVNETDFPDALPDHKEKPLPVCYGTHSQTDLLVGDTETKQADFRGAWPTLFVDVNTTERTFLIARHAVKSINEVYAFTPGRGSVELTETTHYVAFSAGTLAGERMAFIQITQAGWDDVVTDTQGNLGIVTVNVDGKEDAGDGSGELISNPVLVLEDLLENYLGSPLIDGASFDKAQAVARTRTYVTRGGYTVVKGTRQIFQEIANSFNMSIYPSTEGRVAVNIFQPAGPDQTVASVHEQWDILKSTWSIDYTAQVQGAEDAQVVNDIDYRHTFHYAKNVFQKTENVQDATSIASFESKKLTLDVPWSGNDTSAKDAAQRILFLFKDPVAHANFTMPLRGVQVDLADTLKVTHADAPISGGYSDRIFSLVTHSFDPATLSVQVRAVDVDKLSQNGFFLDDESAQERQSDGTAVVGNGGSNITLIGATNLTTSGVVVGDHFELIDPTNEANRVRGVVATPITQTDFDAEDSDGNPLTVWVNENLISYRIVPSWTTASAAQQEHGHLADATTEQFSNGDAGDRLL